jgi:hypothetical protein
VLVRAGSEASLTGAAGGNTKHIVRCTFSTLQGIRVEAKGVAGGRKNKGRGCPGVHGRFLACESMEIREHTDADGRKSWGMQSELSRSGERVSMHGLKWGRGGHPMGLSAISMCNH